MNDTTIVKTEPKHNGTDEAADTKSGTADIAGETSPAQEEEKQRNKLVNRFLNIHSKYRGVALIITTLLWLGAVAGTTYLCWFLLIPSVWEWGFSPESRWYTAVLTVLAAFYLG